MPQFNISTLFYFTISTTESISSKSMSPNWRSGLF